MTGRDYVPIAVGVFAGLALVALLSMSAAASSGGATISEYTESHDVNQTGFNATNDGGELIIGGEEGESFEFEEGTITIEAAISDENRWESSNVEFPTVEVQGIPVDVFAAEGLEGVYNPERDLFTVEGRLTVSTPLQNFQFDLNATTDNADGETTIEGENPSVVVVDDTFAVGETGSLEIDDQLNLPAPEGENVLRIPFELAIETPGQEGREINVTSDESGTTSVRAIIPEVRAGERIDIPVEDASKGYRTEQITITPTNDTRMEMRVSSNTEPLETTPSVRAGFETNTTAVGHVSVDTNLPDEAVEEFEIVSRVNVSQLERWDSDPGSVSMYRFNESLNRWVEKETTVIAEVDGTALLRVVADHPSDWTVAAARPEFEISEAEIEVDAARVGDTVEIDVFVENTGGTEGTYTADLLLNEEVVSTQETVIAEGGEALFDFEPEFDEEGTYEVRVNDAPIDEIQVNPSQENEGDDTEADDGGAESDGSDDKSDDGGGDGFGVVVAVVAIIGGALVGRRKR